jgi:beta-1,4-N-acetylglucosaminyltransferase
MGQVINSLIGIGRYDGERDILPFYHVEMDRHVMVTGGAVVPFKELLLEVITPDFLSALRAHGFTNLHLQCNTFAGEMQKRLSEMDEEDLHGLKIDVIDFDKDLKENMQLLCRGEAGLKAAGVVIGHAGEFLPNYYLLQRV